MQSNNNAFFIQNTCSPYVFVDMYGTSILIVLSSFDFRVKSTLMIEIAPLPHNWFFVISLFQKVQSEKAYINRDNRMKESWNKNCKYSSTISSLTCIYDRGSLQLDIVEVVRNVLIHNAYLRRRCWYVCIWIARIFGVQLACSEVVEMSAICTFKTSMHMWDMKWESRAMKQS